MENKKFKRIDDLNVYMVGNFLATGDGFDQYIKVAEICAVQGKIGQTVKTVLKNGLEETVNTVKADEKTGEPGWIVTGVGGEKYIIEDSAFRAKYETVEGKKDTYKAVGAPVMASPVPEDIIFTAPWGEDMKLEAGGYLVRSDNGEIWGVAKEEFEKTYQNVLDTDEFYQYLLRTNDDIVKSSHNFKRMYMTFKMIYDNPNSDEAYAKLPDDYREQFNKLVRLKLEYDILKFLG